MLDVVAVKESVVAAAREGASVFVSCSHRPFDRLWDQPRFATDAQGLAVPGLGDDYGVAVTAEPLHRLDRYRRTTAAPRQRRLVDVDGDEVVVTAITLLTGEIPGHEIHERIGLPRRPRGISEVRDLERLVIPRLVQGLLEQCTRIHWQLDRYHEHVAGLIPPDLQRSIRKRPRSDIVRVLAPTAQLPAVLGDRHGRVPQEKELEVSIPAGVDNGMRLRLRGEGERGKRGGPSGDLDVVIHVLDHERFQRDGADVHEMLYLTYAQMVLGTEKEIDTLHGKEKVKVAAGTQPGHETRLRGKGIPQLGAERRGDHIVHLMLKVPKPKELDSDRLALLHKLAELEGSEVHHEAKGVFEKVKNLFA